MQIQFTGHGLEITPPLKTYAQKKLDKLERHFEKIMSINVVFHVEKQRQIAEATILITKGEVHASSESDNMYAAIDDLVDKLDRQLLKHKEKSDSHRE